MWVLVFKVFTTATRKLRIKTSKETDFRVFSVFCSAFTSFQSSGSLLNVGSQETRRRVVLPSLAASKSRPTWKSLIERPKL